MPCAVTAVYPGAHPGSGAIVLDILPSPLYPILIMRGLSITEQATLQYAASAPVDAYYPEWMWDAVDKLLDRGLLAHMPNPPGYELSQSRFTGVTDTGRLALRIHGAMSLMGEMV